MTIDVRRIRHVALQTTDLAAAADYYAGPWGLEQVDSGDGVAAFRGTGAEHHCLQLVGGESNVMDHLAFALADRSAVDEAAGGLAARGIALLREPGPLDGPGAGYGFRIADPEARVLEFSTDVEAVPPQQPSATPTNLSHVVLNTTNIDAAAAWWTDVLGFRVSDWSEHQMVFLRCNSDHHSIAFNQADYTSINHAAYEVPSLDAFMQSLGRLHRGGHEPGWGPGRHGPGNNAFSYFVDPSGHVPEVTAEVQQINESTWVPRVWRRVPELSDLWGTAGPPSEEIRGYMAGTRSAR
ncbi:MAG: VOC family protein [Acidimicrobiales bacterium]|jgi:catechol 2,3-dioxygenase-like lactoylglutathione lyase family enzyme